MMWLENELKNTLYTLHLAEDIPKTKEKKCGRNEQRVPLFRSFYVKYMTQCIAIKPTTLDRNNQNKRTFSNWNIKTSVFGTDVFMFPYPIHQRKAVACIHECTMPLVPICPHQSLKNKVELNIWNTNIIKMYKISYLILVVYQNI